MQKFIKKKHNQKLLISICKELFNCLPFEIVQEFYSFYINKIHDSLMEIVLDVIKYLITKFPNKLFYILIDQYKSKIDKNYEKINIIKNMTEINNSKLTVFVCSSINEYDLRFSLNNIIKKKETFYLNYLFVASLVIVPSEQFSELKKEEENLLKDCGNLFNYFYEILNNKGKKIIEQTQKDIENHIIKEINEYYEEKDNEKKLSLIEKIHDIIGNEMEFKNLREFLKLIPLKFFNIFLDKKILFRVDDLNDLSKLKIYPCYPIVIKCINRIYQTSYNIIKDISKNDNISTNTEKSIKSSKLEKNFNNYLWIFRESFLLNECRIIKKIAISSLMSMSKEDSNTLISAINHLKNKNDSILITLKFQNAVHYDSAILKYKSNKKSVKYYELNLFQQTIKKEAKERLTTITLNIEKIYLKYLFYLNAIIKIENIYFFYVFDKSDLDSATLNYCKENEISYLIYDDENFKIIKSEINPIILPNFSYFIGPQEMKKKIIFYKKQILIIL